jgi:hypothetical protein
MMKITYQELVQLIETVQHQIEPEFSAYEWDDEPGILLSVGSDEKSWGYQTGDSQYFGDCYFYENVAEVPIYQDTDPSVLADLIFDDLGA